mgnify:FL=1
MVQDENGHLRLNAHRVDVRAGVFSRIRAIGMDVSPESELGLG